MEKTKKDKITVETRVNASLDKVWKLWNGPEHVMKWNNASDDWHTPKAENDPRPGGKFVYRMEAKDGSIGFDFWGTYEKVDPKRLISYELGDGRRVEVRFADMGEEIRVVETFEAESTNSLELQKGGWQSILNNFKKYAESN